MPTITEYYSSELDEWEHSIIVHTEELFELEKKLAGAISRNCVKGIGTKVETQLSMLNKISGIFNTLHLEIQQQKTLLKANTNQLPGGKLMNRKQTQRVLRLNMQATEKEYIDVKFSCYDFLSGTLKN